MVTNIFSTICFSLIMCYYCAPMFDNHLKSNSPLISDHRLKNSSSLTQFSSYSNSKCQQSNKSQENENSIPEEVLIGLSRIKSFDQLMDYLPFESTNQSKNFPLSKSRNKRKPRNIMKKSKSQWLDHFPGTCSPENQTKVIKASQGKSEIFFPGCIKIPQCSGCCPSDRLTCQPINTSNISIEVMVLRYIPHSRQFKYAGRQRFTFEGHNQCECKCIQKETDCTFGQLYKKEECRCVCRDLSNLSECTSNSAKYWDSSSCSCKCLHHHKCSSGLHFNEKTCSCDTNYYNGSKFYQFGSTNIHNQLMDQVNSLNNSKKNAPSPTTTQLDSSDGFNLLSGNNQDEEFNEMDKLHRSLGYQGINPSSSTVP